MSRTRIEAPPSAVIRFRVFINTYRRPNWSSFLVIWPPPRILCVWVTNSPEGAKMMASPVCGSAGPQELEDEIGWKRINRRTCSPTTLSNASSAETSALTCWARCSHHDGDENRCKIATVHRSRSTAGTTVGSGMLVNGREVFK